MWLTLKIQMCVLAGTTELWTLWVGQESRVDHGESLLATVGEGMLMLSG